MGWRRWNGEQLKVLVNYAKREAVRKTCHTILEAAEQEVPHDEGTLMRSGEVLMAPEGSAEGAIVFGGGVGTGQPVIPYAIRWHETEANFQKGRKRFYLKDPLNKLGPVILNKSLELEVRKLL